MRVFLFLASLTILLGQKAKRLSDAITYPYWSMMVAVTFLKRSKSLKASCRKGRQFNFVRNYLTTDQDLYDHCRPLSCVRER